MKRSRILLIFALIIAIIYGVVSSFYRNNDNSVKTITDSGTILAEETQLNSGNVRYTTKVYLNSNKENLNAIMELEVVSKVKYDKAKEKYVLEKPILNINPVGCTIVDVDGSSVSDIGVNGYYRFSLKENQQFISNMSVATAKELNKNSQIGNVKINDPLSSNINSLDLLKKSNLKEEEISLSYVNNGDSFDIWFEIGFFLDENSHGYFKIF